MAYVRYVEKRFNRANSMLIDYMNELIGDYQRQGYVMTVRQLYYQLVARDVIPNTLADYKRVASIINDAKLAGLMDWDAITDRTRDFVGNNHWTSPARIIRGAANSYGEDMWLDQPARVFVIIEKEALVGIMERVCGQHDVPLMAARGYPSGSVLREFAEGQVLPAIQSGQEVHILHLGDHDPSGIDMTRDIVERMQMFTFGDLSHANVVRLGLNMPQIEELSPPENPAKTTDSRFDGYKRQFGTSSWELDALPPDYLHRLVEDEVNKIKDHRLWNAAEARVEARREELTQLADHYPEVVARMRKILERRGE
ncbi:hypothetical protein [Bacteriophage Phobos]|uniref:DNA topoisomerase n=1 Tax=Bacteriophage Phobos TaxID=2662138 RepID=A0A5Q2U897_9CAUD|nr:DNA topoisomerase [Bacteriophage Phobos]QGH44986.1 hypothetical protein [Bacteriophage Phobos]WPK42382.1 hypothetical protein [Pseudomonas phage Ppu-503]